MRRCPLQDERGADARYDLSLQVLPAIYRTAYLVEPIFRKQDIFFLGIPAKTYEHQSDSSHKRVTLNFCGRCGTTLCLDRKRFPDILGLCGGTFDNPDGSIAIRENVVISSPARRKGAWSYRPAWTSTKSMPSSSTGHQTTRPCSRTR